MTKQPQWRKIANLGDVNPLVYGGYFVYIDRTKQYAPEAELLEVDGEDGDKLSWRVYRFPLDPCTLTDGILSDNKFHPELPAWFAKPESDRANRPQDTTYLVNVANATGQTIEDLQTALTGDDILARAHAYHDIASYHGWENFDSYPRTYSKLSELPRRFRR